MLKRGQLHTYIRILLFLVYLVNGIIAINWNWIVADEADHYSYASRVLKGQPQKVIPYEDASTMPISVVNAIPRAAEQLLKPGLIKNDGGVSDVIRGRYMTLIVCLLIGLFIYRWSRDLWGEAAALFSLFFFVFCPNLMANVTLVGTDAYAALFTLSSAYYFQRFYRTSHWKDIAWFGLHLGLALISKQSLILLPPIYGCIALAIIICRRNLVCNIKINLLRFLLITLLALLVVNLAYLFNGTGRPLSEYAFHSETLKNLQASSLFRHIPLPLPAPFIEGFDLVGQMLSMGSGHEKVSTRSYLFGNYFTGNGLWYYYSVVIFYKTPIVVLILLPGVIGAYLKRIGFHANFMSTGFPLLLAFFFLIFISLTNTSQHGIRHLLMIYPLFYVCIGQVVHWKLFRSRISRSVIAGYSLFTFYSYFPNLVPYTNELLWNKTYVHQVIASSNIDYGQTWKKIQRYLQEHPSVKLATSIPESGEILINVNDYLDLGGSGVYAWMRDLKPIGHVAHTHLLFQITKEDLVRLKEK